MSKVAVVYWSGTGNTEMMAQKVAEGAKEAGAEVSVLTCADFSADDVDAYDAIAFGCPAMGAEELEDTEFEPMFSACESKLSGKKIALFGSYGWGDGMNVFASNNVLFDGVFCRNSDDCTTVYATCMGFKGGCKNITMQNSTLWADVAHHIFIGLHGDAEGQEVMENLNYINIDILDHKEKQIDYQGCMAINVGDNNLVRNVRFENIRIEDFRQGQLVNLRIFFNKKYCAAPGRGIENVLFKDITYNGENAELSIIAGYNEERKVKNIRFENLRINGEAIYDDMPGKPKWYKAGDMCDIYIGNHVRNVVFK